EELLPGTGDDIWRRMFEAARKFSVEVAYPGHPFPHFDDESVCPLCQQDLNKAGERLKRFETFLQQDTAQVAEEAKRSLEEAVNALRGHGLGFEPDGAMTAELAALDATLPDLVMGFQISVETRRQTILGCAKTHDWSGLRPLEGDPRPQLRQHA